MDPVLTPEQWAIFDRVMGEQCLPLERRPYTNLVRVPGSDFSVPCDHCSLSRTGYRTQIGPIRFGCHEVDPCLGYLDDGVFSACCGHGVRDFAHVAFQLGSLSGEEALAWFTGQHVGPEYAKERPS